MSEYYKTTYEDVEAASKRLGLPHRLVHALLERGHSQAAIKEMSRDDRFDEFCEWNGLIGWGPTLRYMMEE